jgi:hypothetical protein
MKILLGDFSAKVGREDILKPTVGNDSLHEISNDNGVRVVNFATSKSPTVQSMMIPHLNIHKFTYTSPDGKTHNKIDHILIDRRRHSSTLHVHAQWYSLPSCTETAREVHVIVLLICNDLLNNRQFPAD